MSAIPTTIDRYQVQGVLGKGGMSIVYLALDPRFNRDVAVKVLSREMMDDVGFRARFATEAQTIASLEHAAIVPVYDFGEVDGQPYLVMRHISGGSLADQLVKGPLHLLDVVRIFNRIAPALDLAHARGVIHRDLKPANILFDAVNEPYVADFGIAKLTTRNNDMTGTGLAIGTPLYMSPEQIRAERGVALDGRSDIYALGAIVYNMMTGHAPYEAESPSGLMMKHLMDPPPNLRAARSDLPEALQMVLDKAMAKNRNERYASVSEMAAALDKAARGEVPHAGPASAATAIFPVAAAAGTAAQVDKTQVMRSDVTRVSPGRAATPVISSEVVDVRAAGPAKPGLPKWLIAGIGAVLALLIAGGVIAALSNRTPAALPLPTPLATLSPAPTAVVVIPPTSVPTLAPPTAAPAAIPVPAATAVAAAATQLPTAVLPTATPSPAPTLPPAPTSPPAVATAAPSPTWTPIPTKAPPTPTPGPTAIPLNWFFTPNTGIPMRGHKRTPVVIRTHADGLEVKLNGNSFFLLRDGTVGNNDAARRRLGAFQSESGGLTCVGDTLADGIVTAYIQGPNTNNILSWSARAATGQLINGWRWQNGVTLGPC